MEYDQSTIYLHHSDTPFDSDFIWAVARSRAKHAFNPFIYMMYEDTGVVFVGGIVELSDWLNPL